MLKKYVSTLFYMSKYSVPPKNDKETAHRS